jgi:ABC-type glycerol-3-phosphate transport system permease component
MGYRLGVLRLRPPAGARRSSAAGSPPRGGTSSTPRRSRDGAPCTPRRCRTSSSRWLPTACPWTSSILSTSTGRSGFSSATSLISVWYKSGTQIRLLRGEEVDHRRHRGRMIDLKKSGAPVNFVQPGRVDAVVLDRPKGARNRDNAMRLMAFTPPRTKRSSANCSPTACPTRRRTPSCRRRRWRSCRRRPRTSEADPDRRGLVGDERGRDHQAVAGVRRLAEPARAASPAALARRAESAVWRGALPSARCCFSRRLLPVPRGPGPVLSLAPGALGSPFHELVTTPVYRAALWRTLHVSVTVTLACLVLGYPVAYTVATAPRPGRGLLLTLAITPFWISVLGRSFTWLVLLQRNGVVNQLLRRSG